MDLRETKWTESVGPGSSPEGIPESRGYILRCSVYHLAARCLAHQKPRRRPAKLQRNAALPGLSVGIYGSLHVRASVRYGAAVLMKWLGRIGLLYIGADLMAVQLQGNQVTSTTETPVWRKKVQLCLSCMGFFPSLQLETCDAHLSASFMK
ncbi:hypothetical protein AOLI_G00055980 [Acnodon oligacanthus]